MIVNKGVNLPVHPSLNHYDISLSNGVRAYFDKIGLNKTVRLVNRIDKDTTGLVVIAKCEYIQECLIKQMNDNSFIKEYIAIARGLIDSSGVIDFPIARKDGSIIERCVDLVRGENAITNYVRLNYNPELDISLVKCRLLTGRTHQIRVHFAYIGHPLLGDSLYGLDCVDVDKCNFEKSKAYLMNHQALQSNRVCFIHPISKKIIDIGLNINGIYKELFE